MNKPSIAIIGGGPAGLTLARILHLHSIPSTVFEREPFSTARGQGGSLDMHADAGQLAIERAGLTTEFKRIARYEDQEGRIYNKHGKLLHLDQDTASKDRPETDRGHLRQMFLDSLPEGIVCWDSDLSAVQPNNDGTYEIILKNGLRERFDLIVGADGAWSRVRPLLSDARPIYSGVTFFELGIDDIDNRYPEVSRMVGRGLTFALGDSKALIAHRDADAHIGTYAAMRVPEDWIEKGGLDMTSNDTTKASLISLFNGWSEDLLQLIHLSNNKMTPRAIHALPVGHRWQHRPGVTIIGDAAHLMSPFGGDGANLAMLDASDLALVIINGDDWKTAVKEFETMMLDRAVAPATGAKEAIEDIFSEHGLEHTLEQFRSHSAQN